MFNEIWPLISVVLGIVILLVLIIGFKLNTFISLIITSMITALMLGIPLTKIMETIEKGMGSTMPSKLLKQKKIKTIHRLTLITTQL